MLNLLVDDRQIQVNIPDEVINEGAEFFQRMDRDMDQGWQIGREWVDQPDTLQRCQIAADKLLTALEVENETLALLMAGYIRAHMPGVTSIRISTDGELQDTEFS